MASMHADRFFQSTRGRIVAELRRRGTASAADLAEAFGLSPNAIRQQLVVLERDDLVVEKPVRRGPTKPTLEFSLTAEAEKLFPQHYDKMLAAVLREVRETHGNGAVDAIFRNIADRAATKAKDRVTASEPEQRVAQLTEALVDSGVMAEYSLLDGGGFALHEHTCPYSSVAKENPEVCSVIHHVMEETLGGEHVQTASLARGDRECCFELKPSAAK